VNNQTILEIDSFCIREEKKECEDREECSHLGKNVLHVRLTRT
jgi:hypothetical protein